MSQTFRRVSMFMLVLISSTLLGASSTRAQDATPSAAQKTVYPLTIENCGRTLTFAKAPERVVPLYPLTAEFLLRLGLGDRIIGAAFTNGDPVAPELADAYAALPVISADAPPSREVLLAATPDLVIDNFPFYFLDENQGFASVDQLAAQGAQVYTLTARCSGNEATGKLTDLYTDVLNLGKIFDVQAEAEAMVAQMQARVAAVQEQIAGLPPVTVMIYDGGTDPLIIYGPGAISSVVEAAGGQNVFGDLDSEFNMLSAEQVAAANPDVIIVLDHQAKPSMSMTKEMTFEEQVAYLKATFPGSNAAKNDRYLSLPYQQVYASLQNVDGVEAMARAFYPDAFGESATPIPSPST